MVELFDTGAFKAVELARDAAAGLQAFLERNQEYHLLVCGEPPAADEAQKMFESTLPEGWRYQREWMVEGNARAERFWLRAGYVEVRKREGVELGRRTHVVRVMVKPLAQGKLADYLAKVARDRPDTP